MSSSGISVLATGSGSMLSFQYRTTNAGSQIIDEVQLQEEITEPEIRLTEQLLSERLAAERAVGFSSAVSKMQQGFDQNAALNLEKITRAIAGFEQAQKAYFARVETEVVQLALAIAGKILHREAQVDPMLVAAIVHLALGQLKEGSTATIRVTPEEATKWRDHTASFMSDLIVKVTEDSALEQGDCVLETELGTANFSLDAQLKEVERGFFDVLAQKPKV